MSNLATRFWTQLIIFLLRGEYLMAQSALPPPCLFFVCAGAGGSHKNASGWNVARCHSFFRDVVSFAPQIIQHPQQKTLFERGKRSHFFVETYSVLPRTLPKNNIFYRIWTFVGSFWGPGALRGCREAMKERRRAPGQPREAPKGSMEAPMGPSRGAPEALWR